MSTSMSEQAKINLRINARSYGVTLNVLALVALVATLLGFGALQFLGSQFGFNGSKNAFAWIELGIGLFATISLAAFGTVLGMLCAIVDNQLETMRRLANAPAEN